MTATTPVRTRADWSPISDTSRNGYGYQSTIAPRRNVYAIQPSG